MARWDIERLAELVEELAERVKTLEGLLTPEQHAQMRLIRQAEQLIDHAKSAGQL